MADISHIFFELVRSELNANQMRNFAAQDKTCATLPNINESNKLAQIDNVCEPDSDQSKSK